MEETFNELFSKLKGSFPNGEIPPGRNPQVECIRLTLDPVNPEHRPLAFYFVLTLIFLADEGCLSPTELGINPLPRLWIYLLSRRSIKSTHPRLLVPCPFPPRLRSSPSHGHPWHRFGSLINLVRHKPRKSRSTPTYFRPRLETY